MQWIDDPQQLISVTTLVSGGTTIAASDYFLEPEPHGPPYNRIEINLASAGVGFDSGDTWQRSNVITGLWGYRNDTRPAGTITGTLGTGDTTIAVDSPESIGVGDLIQVGDERMQVTERAWADSTIDINGALTAEKSSVTVAVDDGSGFTAGESILVDSEEMLVVAVAGNNLTVKRAQRTTALAAHSDNADVYTSSSLTVERGAYGTTAATHTSGAAVTAHVVPADVVSYVVAGVLADLGFEKAGGGDGTTTDRSVGRRAGSGPDAALARVVQNHGRRTRLRSI